jgi:hypothetical protein
LEFAFAAWFTLSIVFVILFEPGGLFSLPFLLLFQAGFLYVAMTSLMHTIKSLRARRILRLSAELEA